MNKNPPQSPFGKGDFPRQETIPLFEKEGEGRFLRI
jgi:hypothetical protein